MAIEKGGEKRAQCNWCGDKWVCGGDCPPAGVVEHWDKIGKIRVDVEARLNPDTNKIEVRLVPKHFGDPDR